MKMKTQMLIIQINKKEDQMGFDEYVKPIETIVKKTNQTYKIINYKNITNQDINETEKIIICGTFLNDLEYLKEENMKKFEWIKTTNVPLFGICAGAQILLKTYGGKQELNQEIGLFTLQILKEDDIVKQEDLKEIYCLHTNAITTPAEFETYAKTDSCDQIVKLKNKKQYACLFHAEARNKKLIERFANF